jgi:ABC-type multidrug transport system fused ATPase/permease subunit
VSFTIGTSGYDQHGPMHAIETFGKDPAGSRGFDLRTTLRLAAFLRPHWLRMLAALAFMIASSGLTLLTPYLIKVAIDRHIASGDLAGLDRIALLAALAFLALTATKAGQQYTLSWVGQRVLAALRQELFGLLQRIHLGYHDTHIMGVTVSRVINDVEVINSFLSEGLIQFLGDLLVLAGIVVVMVLMSPPLALAALLVLPLMGLVTAVFSRHARSAFSATRSRVAAVVGGLAENLAGMRVIQAFAQEESSQRRFDGLNRDNREAHVRAMSLAFVFLPAVEFLSILATAVVLWYGGYSVTRGAASVGTVVAFLSYVTRFFHPIQDISQIYTTMQSAMAGGRKVVELLETAPEVADAPGADDLPAIRGRVELRRVSFAYREGRRVLEGIDLAIEPGQTVALVGKTGAGKTTLAALVARFYDVTGGEIRIDGRDIRSVTQRSLRRQMGIVSQDPFLFSGTIGDNIRFACPSAGREAVERAAEAANAHSFIRRLPDGYDTRILEGAANLSSGQRQLLCIARAVLADPRIIILDEATASVDTLTERLIQQALERLFAGRTAIVIAHRLTTVQNADRIYVLEQGRIVETGRHAELLARGGIYRELYDRQFIDKEEPGGPAAAAGTEPAPG